MRGDLPDDKADILEAWLTEQGCTLGALLESLVDVINATDGEPARMVGRAEAWVAGAKRITAERRKRPR
jgi:hypothetical protein